MAKSVIFLYITTLALLQLVSSSALCSHESDFFRIGLQSQCPIAIAPYPPLKVDGNFIDRVLASKQKTGYTSVLFYASWCPFSRRLYPTFEMLSFMFPQVEHLAVEQSSAFPSVFSRHGIPSFPSILIVNQTSRVRYNGPKDFLSLIQFYQKITGLEPVQYYNDDQPFSLQCGEKSILQSMSNVSSLREIAKREPYLVFAILFLCLRVLIHMFPKVQKNARVWASSLTSVSLGESSSARSSSS
ncbi:hypothetical protein M0R45_001565 [Rubus argutus]|uniref:Thioredoxin domain-containing protein n=1 Tax=Rubus argutus TaxID=59490 RepID=A0AAW1VLS4_RUBAR